MINSSDKADETWPGAELDSPPPEPSREDDTAIPLAENYLRAGVFSSKALKVFEKAVAASPGRGDLEKALSICFLIEAVTEAVRSKATPSERGEESVAEQREAVESLFGQFPSSPDLAKCLGDVRLLQGEWEGATHAYRLAQSKGYRDDQAIVNSGRSALARDDCPPSILRFFGDLAMALGQFGQALEFFAKALRNSLKDRNAAIEQIEYLTERLLPKVTAAGEKDGLLAEIVWASTQLGMMDRAVAALGQMDLANYAKSDLVKPIARYLIDQEDYRQAFDYLSRVPFDQETKALVNEITVKLEQRGEIDTAVYLLQYINDHDPVIQEAQKIARSRLESAATRELAELCFRSGRYDAAFSHYLILIRQNAPDVGEYADRIETAAIQVEKPKAEDLLAVAEHFHKRRDWRRAESFLNRAMTVDAHNERVRELLRAVYDALLEAEPGIGRIRLKSGDLHLAEGRLEDAIAEYQKVLLSPGYETEARRRLAAALIAAGRPREALEQHRGLEMRNSDLAVLYDLHESLMKQGLHDEALEAATMIYSFDAKYRDVQDRIARLERRGQEPESELLRDEKMVELIGEQAVGRYRYIEQIGSGGMGVVHKVYDVKNQCPVAMKILRESLTSSSKAIDRFFREARIAATLSHPNIVNIFDYNINNIHGRSYISMEYVDGLSLRDIIEKRFAETGELTSDYIAEILFYTAQLCDALEATHLKGIIHRDIKPDNIMITRDRVVKITDFGIVHIEEATFTPTGALIGTPRYMSPEQVRGGRVDCRSDIYAAGIIIYESLIGTPPFISGDIAYQHVNVAPAPPREVNAAIPPEVERIILCCLDKDAKQRYQRAKELKRAIDEVLQKIYAGIVSRLYQSRTASASTVDSPNVTE